MGADLPQDQWSKETGNAQNVKQKSQSFLLNPPLTGQFTAANAGRKKGLQEISADKS